MMTTAVETHAPRIELHREAPELYRAMRALNAAQTGLDPSLRELLNIRVSQINGCAFCLDMHTKDARAAGETEQRIYLLNAWRESPFYTPKECAALALAESMTLISEGHVPDEVYAEAARHFDPPELAQLIWRITIINAWNRIAITSHAVPGSYQPRARGDQ
jgi:AhpD family alkylhydroperoxidase